MRKFIALLLVIVISCASLSGCTAIKDDGTRTKTEGTLVGAGVGAVIGAGIGALIGGRQGAALGAAIGGAAGGAIGFAVGTHVANKKAEYATEEAWLDACIAHVEKVNKEVGEYNKTLLAEMTALDKETKSLKKKYAAKSADRNAMLAQKKILDDKIASTKEVIDGLNTEIAEQSKVLLEAKASEKKSHAKTLDKEIDKLRMRKKQLEQCNTRLVGMSSRVAV